MLLLLLLLLQLCPTLCDPTMAAHQAPQSLGFSRQEHWSGLPFPAVHGIFQARVLEWVAIAFSDLEGYNKNFKLLGLEIYVAAFHGCSHNKML